MTKRISIVPMNELNDVNLAYRIEVCEDRMKWEKEHPYREYDVCSRIHELNMERVYRMSIFAVSLSDMGLEIKMGGIYNGEYHTWTFTQTPDGEETTRRTF